MVLSPVSNRMVPGVLWQLTRGSMACMAQDGLLGLLYPLWQFAIGGCVLVTLVLATRRLMRRGPSRMTRALLVTGGAAVCLAVLGILLAR
jgi:hypothetical protein